MTIAIGPWLSRPDHPCRSRAAKMPRPVTSEIMRMEVSSIRRSLNGSLEFPRISAFVLNPDLSDGRTISQMCQDAIRCAAANFGGGWQVNPSHEFS